MMVEEQAQHSNIEIDDSFLDWEHRDEQFPLYKHMIAGKINSNVKYVLRIPCRYNGTCWNVSTRYCESKIIFILNFQIDAYVGKWKKNRIL